jgi:large subunit ribosomal protein L29
MQKATQQLNNTATLRSARRDIARAKTILVEKQSAETATSKATPSVAAK